MNLAESFRIALRALNANKVRSGLTMLGVIIGVSAVILLVAIGTGVKQQVTGSIEGLGSNLLFVLPGKMDQGGGGGGGFGQGITKQFTLDDVDYLRLRLGAQAKVVPLVQAQADLRAANRTQTTQITASDENGAEVTGSKLAAGRWYTASEYTAASRVLVIGPTPAKELFPGQQPVGRKVDVNGQPFTVIGLLESKGGGLGGNADNQVAMPVTSAQQLLGTGDVSSIIVSAENSEQIDQIQSQIKQLMRPRFGDKFTVFTQAQTLGILSTLLGTLTVMLAGIASISLLVGGIGIMNIMLVSVSERTREIGIRKAVGARTFDILSQFVIEAVVLSAVGGLIGIALGWLGALALKPLVATQVTFWAVALAFMFSAGVGIFFGVYPAWRASRLDPITALRYE